MCVVSNIYDYGRHMYPTPPPPMFAPYVPRTPTPEEWAAFLELVEKARKFDEMTGEADCEDPEKGAWMEAVEARLRALESPSNA